MNSQPHLGIIGGSGLYNFSAIQDIEPLEIDTPFGKPSSPIISGRIAGKKVSFLARHGIGHFITPSEVNYRANIYALKALGVTEIVSVSACGSLREDFSPGDIVIPNQIFDFTHKRERSFFGEGLAVHVGAADPFCSSLSTSLSKAVVDAGGKVHNGGTYITIEGPRFSTKAESNLYRSWGISIIGMTASPEAFLAREAEICYSTMAHVTDYDVWHISQETVSVDLVVRTLQKNTLLAQNALIKLVEELETNPDCPCHHSLKDAIITGREKILPETRHKLDILLKKYL